MTSKYWAVATGLEPAICSVTESYVNQLHHATSELNRLELYHEF